MQVDKSHAKLMTMHEALISRSTIKHGNLIGFHNSSTSSSFSLKYDYFVPSENKKPVVEKLNVLQFVEVIPLKEKDIALNELIQRIFTLDHIENIKIVVFVELLSIPLVKAFENLLHNVIPKHVNFPKIFAYMGAHTRQARNAIAHHFKRFFNLTSGILFTDVGCQKLGKCVCGIYSFNFSSYPFYFADVQPIDFVVFYDAFGKSESYSDAFRFQPRNFSSMSLITFLSECDTKVANVLIEKLEEFKQVS
jgi:hypothetical protein